MDKTVVDSAVLLLLLMAFNVIMARVFKVERCKLFTCNYVNDAHKILDWAIRLTIIFFMLVGYTINYRKDFLDPIWYLEPHYLLFILIFLSGTMRAYMEWKYAKNRNAYKFTLRQLGFGMILLLIVFITHGFGLFE